MFTYDVELDPDSIPAIARPVLRWWVRRTMRADLKRLHGLLEARPSSRAG